MNIILNNKFLYFQKYKLKCSIGKSGISYKKKEGDNKTPRGEFKFEYILYRKDRIINLKTKLKTLAIKKNMGWCDDSRSKSYNRLVKIPFKYTYEKLWLKKNIYDIIIVLNYNRNPTIKNRGSAIFLHIAKKKYQATKGCIAISKSNIKLLVSKLRQNTKLIIL
jgi:L,D-peptidoglycan transpeptidase YkuD (ErfK/YbiS/YcfS/YnhG family)